MSEQEKEILEEQTEEDVVAEDTEKVEESEATATEAEETSDEACEEENTDSEDAGEEKEGGILKNFKKKDKKLEALETVNSIIKSDDKLKQMGLAAKSLLKDNIIENIVGIVEKK